MKIIFEKEKLKLKLLKLLLKGEISLNASRCNSKPSWLNLNFLQCFQFDLCFVSNFVFALEDCLKCLSKG